MRTKLIPMIALLFALSGPAIAVDEMMVVSAVADPGDSAVAITIQGTNDQPFQGLSLALRYDTNGIDCVGASVTGTVIEAASPGGSPEFLLVAVDDAFSLMEGVATIGVIFDLDPTNVMSVDISDTVPQDWIHVLFDVSAEALPDVHDVILENGLGTPPVENAYSSFGFSYFPIIGQGTLTVQNNFLMRIPNQTLGAGVTTDVLVLGDFPLDLNGFQLSLTYDNSSISINEFADFNDWTLGLDSQAVVPSTALPIEFFNPQVVPSLPSTPSTGWIGLSAILDNLPPFEGQVIPAGVDKSIVRLQVTTDPTLTVGDTTTIAFTNTGVLPDVTLDNVFVVLAGLSVAPVTIDGTIEIDDVVGGFRRADANIDSTVNVADAIYIINWQFVGGPAPQCMDSADANDDGGVNIADTIFIINWQFAGGPQPGNPGPTTCGPDPTDDGQGCALYPSC
ncbi:MAG: hypothetical protein AAF488_15495 [Planctomycetota bacterium]